METCNHEEADTRIVRHASLVDKPAVIVTADTDIFVLMIRAYNKTHPTEKWHMNITKKRYLDISHFCNAYGKRMCDVLPGYHSVTGCDTTSYPFKVGKIKPLKKMKSQDKYHP